MGLKSPERPAKLTMSVSVMVRPGESQCWPTSTSSKYKCCSVNMGFTLEMGDGFFGQSTRRRSVRLATFGHERDGLSLGRGDIDAYVNHLCFCHLQDFCAPVHFDINVHGDGGA